MSNLTWARRGWSYILLEVPGYSGRDAQDSECRSGMIHGQRNIAFIMHEFWKLNSTLSIVIDFFSRGFRG